VSLYWEARRGGGQTGGTKKTIENGRRQKGQGLDADRHREDNGNRSGKIDERQGRAMQLGQDQSFKDIVVDTEKGLGGLGRITDAWEVLQEGVQKW